MTQSKRHQAEPRWPIWSLLWRMIVFGPVLLPIGLVILLASITSVALPFFGGVYLFAAGYPLLGIIAFVLGIFFVPYWMKFMNWLLQGQEYSSL